MAEVVARIKLKGKNFEILVDCDKAMAFKKGQNVSANEFFSSDSILYDWKKGLKASESDIKNAFGTTDVFVIAAKIVKEGEMQLPQEYRDKEREMKVSQVIDFISKNCTDPKGGHHPPERIKTALKETGARIDNRPVEEQVPEILKYLQKVLPIRLETKKMSVQVLAAHVGKVYGILKGYISKEDWQSDGSLLCIIEFPAAIQMSLFDKINGVTHGSAIIKELSA